MAWNHSGKKSPNLSDNPEAWAPVLRIRTDSRKMQMYTGMDPKGLIKQ